MYCVKQWTKSEAGRLCQWYRLCEKLPKMQKHKFASIPLTVRDRAMSSKFSIHRVSQQSTLANFVQVLEQNSCFPLGGYYACQCILFLV